MNQTLQHLIKLYATTDHKSVRDAIFDLSKDSLASTFLDLLTMYLNDRNSSTLREIITVTIAGYSLHEGKLGYNGYRHLAPDKPAEYCEAKPVNVRFIESNGKYNRSLNGGGSISDYTPERLYKDLEINPRMLVSGFVDGKLIYILSFPFSCLEEKLSLQLEKQFPNGIRPTGTYLRSANFNFTDYKNCYGLIKIYISNDIKNYKESMTNSFYEWITNDTQRLF